MTRANLDLPATVQILPKPQMNAQESSYPSKLTLEESFQEKSDDNNCLALFKTNVILEETKSQQIPAAQRVNEDVWIEVFKKLVSHEEMFPGPSTRNTLAYRNQALYHHSDIIPWDMNRYSLRLSLVCRKWRQILHSTSCLWAAIPIMFDERQTNQLEYLKHHILFLGSSDIVLIVSALELVGSLDVSRYIAILSTEAVKTFKYQTRSLSAFHQDQISPWLSHLSHVENVVGQTFDYFLLSRDPGSWLANVRFMDISAISSYLTPLPIPFSSLDFLATSLRSLDWLSYCSPRFPFLRKLHITETGGLSFNSEETAAHWAALWGKNNNGDRIKDLILSPESLEAAIRILPFLRIFKSVQTLDLRRADGVHIFEAIEKTTRDRVLSTSAIEILFPALKHLIMRDFRPSTTLLKNLIATRESLSVIESVVARLERVTLQEEPGTPEKLFHE